MGSFILREKPGKKIVENLYKWWSCKFKKSGLNELNKPPMLISIPGLASHPSFQKWHRSHVFVGWWTSKPLKTLGEKTKKKHVPSIINLHLHIDLILENNWPLWPLKDPCMVYILLTLLDGWRMSLLFVDSRVFVVAKSWGLPLGREKSQLQIYW